MVLNSLSSCCGSGWQNSTNSKPSVPMGFSSERVGGGASCGNGPIWISSCHAFGPLGPSSRWTTHPPQRRTRSCYSGRVRLARRSGILKGFKAGASRIDGCDLGVSVERDVEAPGIEDLRHEVNVRQGDAGAEGEG